MKLNLIKTGLTKEVILHQIPLEILDPLEIDFIDCYKQQKLITDKPTLKTIAQELMATHTDKPAMKLLLRALADTKELSQAEWEIAIFKCRSQAVTKLVMQFSTLDDEDKKGRSKLTLRIMELSKAKENQYHDPINATNWEALVHAEEEEIYIAIDWLERNNVPLKKKVLYAFIATTNGGKTIIKTWFATKIVEKGKNVLYLALEEPYSDTIRRIYQTALSITESKYKELTKDTFQIVGERYAKHAKDNGYGQIHVAEWGGIKIDTIADKIKEFREVKGIEIDALIIDYGKLVETSNPRKNSQEWERIGNIFQELKSLAMEQKIIVMTSVQLNRDASQKLTENGTMADLHDVAGAYDAMTHTNYCFSVRLQGKAGEDIDYDNPECSQGMYTLMVQKQKYGMLRKGDQRHFHWNTAHQLQESMVDQIEIPSF